MDGMIHSKWNELSLTIVNRSINQAFDQSIGQSIGQSDIRLIEITMNRMTRFTLDMNL